MHVNQCIETLHLSPTCYVDVTPLLVYEGPDAPIGTRANFNVHHKCRRLDKFVKHIDHQPQVSIATKLKLSQLYDHARLGIRG
ncbi:hypothetical protein GGI35DRAFT_461745 [Trichoderma velutinum]